MRRKKEVRRSRSAPDRRKKREGASQCTLGQSRPSDLATNPETGRTAAMYQVNPDHGASSSMSHGNQDWTDARESAEEWNRWHLQYAAAWMRQNYTPPANLPMVSPPTPKYGGKKGQRKGKGGKPTQGKKEENQDTLTSGLGENVKKALEMWRIMENPTIKGPVRDLGDLYGENATQLARGGKSFMCEMSRTQSFKKAKSAMRSFGRLHGRSGVGIFDRGNDLYGKSSDQYKKAWG